MLWIIPAIREEKKISYALKSPSPWVFLLYGNICDLEDVVNSFHKVNKKVFVHLDLVQGLGKEEASIIFLKRKVNIDGIITTKGNLIEIAKKEKIITILRIFLLDSLAVTTGLEQAKTHKPHFVELLPGVIPTAISKVVSELRKFEIPVLTGGLVKTKEEVEKAIQAGALGVSTSEVSLWEIYEL